MGIRKIDLHLCNACGICIEACPMDVLREDRVTGKPLIKYLRDCQACLLCEIKCPCQAIYVSAEYERRIPVPIYY